MAGSHCERRRGRGGGSGAGGCERARPSARALARHLCQLLLGATGGSLHQHGVAAQHPGESLLCQLRLPVAQGRHARAHLERVDRGRCVGREEGDEVGAPAGDRVRRARREALLTRAPPARVQLCDRLLAVRAAEDLELDAVAVRVELVPQHAIVRAIHLTCSEPTNSGATRRSISDGCSSSGGVARSMADAPTACASIDTVEALVACRLRLRELALHHVLVHGEREQQLAKVAAVGVQAAVRVPPVDTPQARAADAPPLELVEGSDQLDQLVGREHLVARGIRVLLMAAPKPR
eukprot:7391059-Prymnesium_polylepis.2